MRIVRIPQERIGALIGKKGDVKKYIQEETGIIIDVDSKTGEVSIDDQGAKNPIFSLKVDDFISAVGRGFSPEKAYDLLDDDMYLEVFDMRDYAGKSPKHLRRIKARIIGQRGRTRKVIEQLTGCFLSIYGTSVAIISEVEGLESARKAVDMLLGGSEHSMVYSFLERKRREDRMAQLESIVTGKDGGPEPRDDLEAESEEDAEE